MNEEATPQIVPRLISVLGTLVVGAGLALMILPGFQGLTRPEISAIEQYGHAVRTAMLAYYEREGTYPYTQDITSNESLLAALQGDLIPLGAPPFEFVSYEGGRVSYELKVQRRGTVFTISSEGISR